MSRRPRPRRHDVSPEMCERVQDFLAQGPVPTPQELARANDPAEQWQAPEKCPAP